MGTSPAFWTAMAPDPWDFGPDRQRLWQAIRPDLAAGLLGIGAALLRGWWWEQAPDWQLLGPGLLAAGAGRLALALGGRRLPAVLMAVCAPLLAVLSPQTAGVLGFGMLLGAWRPRVVGGAGLLLALGLLGRAIAEGGDPVGVLVLHWGLPTWTGHPLLGGLGALAVLLPSSHRLPRFLLFCTAGLLLLAGSWTLGAAATGADLVLGATLMAVLTSVPLSRLPWLPLLLLWPQTALLSHYAQLRTAEEAGPIRPAVPWPLSMDLVPLYQQRSLCGADELRALVSGLADRAPQGGEVAMLQLRDGREALLLEPLKALRPDLRVSVVSADCCGASPDGCADRLRTHLEAGATWVAPVRDAQCTTGLLGEEEQALAGELADTLGPGRVFGYWTWHQFGSAEVACEAMKGE
jgi:hypothetical protein